MSFLGRVMEILAVVTDWLLIAAGALLTLTALRAVDVATARYLLVGVGTALSGIGLWYRSRRLRSEKK